MIKSKQASNVKDAGEPTYIWKADKNQYLFCISIMNYITG